MFKIDHLIIAAETLADGTALAEDTFGLRLSEIGRHDLMGTHNRLLSLGPDIYLEVIAVDPDAEGPDHARWYDLDRFEGSPRLHTWAMSCADLEAAKASARIDFGRVISFARGPYRWRMAVPQSGHLPFDNLHPAIMQWEGAEHPAPALPDQGVRLTGLDIWHREPIALGSALAGLEDPRVHVREGRPHLSARFSTPAGEITLG